MGHVKQHTHPIGEVRGEDKNTYECVLKQQNSRKIANVRFSSPEVLLAGREVPFSTQAKKMEKQNLPYFTLRP